MVALECRPRHLGSRVKFFIIPPYLWEETLLSKYRRLYLPIKLTFDYIFLSVLSPAYINLRKNTYKVSLVQGYVKYQSYQSLRLFKIFLFLLRKSSEIPKLDQIRYPTLRSPNPNWGDWSYTYFQS